MILSAGELDRARDISGSLLEELRLDAYLFEVEPVNGHWEIRVECAVAEGWGTCRITVDRETLPRAAVESAERRRLIDDWGKTLAACLKSDR